MSLPSGARVHLVVGVIAILLLPLVSWLDGSGQLAWTMFSRTGRYRLQLVADGRVLNPTEIAAAAGPGPTSWALAGADHFQHQDVTRATLRRHLSDVALLACRLRPGTTLIARLDELPRTDAEIETTEVTVQCAR
jgi:hypothetical protein